LQINANLTAAGQSRVTGWGAFRGLRLHALLPFVCLSLLAPPLALVSASLACFVLAFLVLPPLPPVFRLCIHFRPAKQAGNSGGEKSV
jgi:hypothetical protein